MTDPNHDIPAPSPWVAEHLSRIGAGEARVLDLAAGRGRHAMAVLDRGHRVLAVDRDCSGLAQLDDRAGALEGLEWDLENGTPWPFMDEKFKAVLVVNYLHRDTLLQTLQLVDTGGVLIYETFGSGNGHFGRPSNPDFLAKPGEIAEIARDLGFWLVADDFLEVTEPAPAIKTRVVAIG